MIAYLEGNVIHRSEDSLILNVQGVGYHVHVNPQTMTNDTELALFIYTAVSENDIRLYGFSAQNELDLFKKFISVKGVGPKYALGLLNIPYESLHHAITQNKPQILTSAPGIGKKSAERIVLELKNKMGAAVGIPQHIDQSFIEEAIAALTNLGYKRHHIETHFVDTPKEVTDTESAIRHFLKSQ